MKRGSNFFDLFAVPLYVCSNLSKMWFAYELQRRYPDLTVPVLHPGVIDSELSQVNTYMSSRV